jgi:hypothetical protein
MSLLPSPRNQRPVTSDLGHYCPLHTSRQLVTPATKCSYLFLATLKVLCLHLSILPCLRLPLQYVILSPLFLPCFIIPLRLYLKMFRTLLVFYSNFQLDRVFFSAWEIVTAFLYIWSHFPCNVVFRKLGCITLRRGRNLRVSITVSSDVTWIDNVSEGLAVPVWKKNGMVITFNQPKRRPIP